MPLRRLHLIDHDGMHCYRSEGGRLLLEERFDADDEGVTAFGHWLQQGRANGIHTLLIDLPDEGFHFELIPHVIGADREALIARKKTQHFFGSPLAAAISLGREKEGRRDERMLFAAITQPATVEPWLAAMREAHVALRAAFAPPLLLRPLLEGMHVGASRGLIIALSPSGIRQIYYDDGKLRFARLTPPPDGAYTGWGPDCLREANKTYQYISAQRWIPRNSPLPVWLIAADHEAAALIPQLTGGEPLDFHPVSLQALQKHFGISEPVVDSNSRALFLRLALRVPARPQLAPDSERGAYRLWQARSAILVAGVAALGVGALLAGKAWLDARALQEQTAQIRMEAQREEGRYQALLASLPKLPTTLDTLRGVADAHARLTQASAGPRPLLTALSRALENYPEVDLLSLEWRNEIDTTGNNTPNAGNNSPPAANGYASSAQISASLPAAAASDPRAAIERIRALLDELRAQPGIEVSQLQQPFDVESDKTLKSTAASRTQRPEFSFRISMREGQKP